MPTGEGVDLIPPGGDEKLEGDEDIDAGRNADVVEAVDSAYFVEEDGNPCPVGEHGIEANLQLSEVFIAAPENELGENILGVDFHHDGPVREPQPGLVFETKEAAYSFYREYGRSVGFGITIKASRRSKKSGKFIDVKLACSRFGIKRESDSALNPRTCPKTDCKASMHMKRREDGMWVIHSFVKEHNHEFFPDDFYQSIRVANKQLGAATRPKKGLRLALSEEDVQVMLENFTYMQDENPNFFYAIDLDHGKRLRNVLWIDPKGRHEYSSFSDIVFFDTYYIGNKYHLPFLPIVGVNNHLQYILLGSAFLGNQTSSSYSWVMQTWLRVVGGKSPRVVITDQDKSLEEAVAEVFPESRHCFCLWHVLRKIPGNLGYVIAKHENFIKEFDECIRRCFTGEQFEDQWEKLVLKFELGEDDWVRSLYENRRKWVPAYMKDVFLAGFSTAARSESIITFFDKYIHKETTIKEFMEKCRIYMQERYELESAADAESHEMQLSVKSLSPLEKKMSTIYTSSIFKQFQDEVLAANSCRLQKRSENEVTGIFQVEESGVDEHFIVHWNEKQLEVCCSCQSFEYRGYLCRHSMFVLQTLGVSSIPPKYILKRWTKEAKIRDTSHNRSIGYSCRLQRFNDLCRRAIKLGQEASISQEAYDVAFLALQEAFRHCAGMKNTIRTISDQDSIYPGVQNQRNMPAQSSKKKKYKKRKVHSEVEQIQENCQQDVPGAQPQDENHGDSPEAEEAEALNSVPPVQGPYYINFSAGTVHVDPALTGIGLFDVQTRFEEIEQPLRSMELPCLSTKKAKGEHQDQ